MLPRTTYRKVLKMLDHYRAQHEADRKAYPNRVPIGWLSSITNHLQRILSEDRVYPVRDRVQQTIQELLAKGLLIPYLGDVTFPGTVIPSIDQIKKEVEEDLARLGGKS